MARDITSAMAVEFEADHALPLILAEMEFDTETLRMWNGVGTLTWDGNDFLGAGNLATISSIGETQGLEAKGLIVTLSGIPSSLLSVAFNERSRGRAFRLWLAAVDTSGGSLLLHGGGRLLLHGGGTLLLHGTSAGNTLIADPYQCFTGIMDVMEITDDGETSVIRLSVENSLILGQRRKIGRLTAEDQKKTYPYDLGLDNINQLIDKEVVW